jgi:hypothetical protein
MVLLFSYSSYHSLSALVIGYILKASALLHLLRDVSCSLAFLCVLMGVFVF